MRLRDRVVVVTSSVTALALAFAFASLGCRDRSPPTAEENLDRSERYGAVTIRYPSSFTRLSKPGFMVQRGDESFAVAGGPVADGEATDLRTLKEKTLAGPMRAAQQQGNVIHETTERTTTCAGRPALETRTRAEDSAGKPMQMRACVFTNGKSGYFVFYRGPLKAGLVDDPLLARMLDALEIAPSDRNLEVAP